MRGYGFWLCNLCKLALNWGFMVAGKFQWGVEKIIIL